MTGHGPEVGQEHPQDDPQGSLEVCQEREFALDLREEDLGQGHQVVLNQGQGQDHRIEKGLGLREEGHHTDAQLHHITDRGHQEDVHPADWGQEADRGHHLEKVKI